MSHKEHEILIQRNIINFRKIVETRLITDGEKTKYTFCKLPTINCNTLERSYDHYIKYRLRYSRYSDHILPLAYK